MCGVRAAAATPTPYPGIQAATLAASETSPDHAASALPSIEAQCQSTRDGRSDREPRGQRGEEDGRSIAEGGPDHHHHHQQQQQQQQQQQEATELGHNLLAVRVWPCARLPRGCAALSSSVVEACGRPQPGASAVVLFRMPRPLQAVPVCQTLALRVGHSFFRMPRPLQVVPVCQTLAFRLGHSFFFMPRPLQVVPVSRHWP